MPARDWRCHIIPACWRIAAYLSSGLAPATLAAQARSAVPNLVHGACPFECCTLGTWTADAPIRSFRVPRDTARVAFRLSPGDAVEAETGDVYVRSAGIVVLQYPLDQQAVDSAGSGPAAAPGDTLYLLSYEGEDSWVVWYGGRQYSLWRFWVDSGKTPRPRFPGVLARPLQAEWWVRLRNRHGARGWIEAGRIEAGTDAGDGTHSTAAFRGSDACGG